MLRLYPIYAGGVATTTNFKHLDPLGSGPNGLRTIDKSGSHELAFYAKIASMTLP